MSKGTGAGAGGSEDPRLEDEAGSAGIPGALAKDSVAELSSALAVKAKQVGFAPPVDEDEEDGAPLSNKAARRRERERRKAEQERKSKGQDSESEPERRMRAYVQKVLVKAARSAPEIVAALADGKEGRRYGVDVDCLVDGVSALHVAARYSSEACIAALLKAGASQTLCSASGLRPLEECLFSGKLNVEWDLGTAPSNLVSRVQEFDIPLRAAALLAEACPAPVLAQVALDLAAHLQITQLTALLVSGPHSILSSILEPWGEQGPRAAGSASRVLPSPYYLRFGRVSLIDVVVMNALDPPNFEALASEAVREAARALGIMGLGNLADQERIKAVVARERPYLLGCCNTLTSGPFKSQKIAKLGPEDVQALCIKLLGTLLQFTPPTSPCASAGPGAHAHHPVPGGALHSAAALGFSAMAPDLTPLLRASRANNEKVAALLLDAKPDSVEDRDSEGNTALHSVLRQATEQNRRTVDVRLVARLLQCGAKVLAANKSGATTVHTAAGHGHADALNLLLKCDRTAVNVLSSSKETALHYAAKNSHVKCVKVLLEYGANVHVVSKYGMNPYDVAENDEIRRMLVQAGAKPGPGGKSGEHDETGMAGKQDAAILTSLERACLEMAHSTNAPASPVKPPATNPGAPRASWEPSKAAGTAHDYLYKTKICMWYNQGTCTFGAHCKYAHGEDDLRPFVPPSTARQLFNPSRASDSFVPGSGAGPGGVHHANGGDGGFRGLTSAYGLPRPGLSSDEPESVARRIFVGGLPTDLLDNDTLMALFAAEFGPVEDAIIMKHNINGQEVSRCFGFVLFCDKGSAEDAIAAHWVPFQHRRVEVKAAVPRGASFPTAPRPVAEAPAHPRPYAPAGSASPSVEPALSAQGPTHITLDAFLADNDVEPFKDNASKADLQPAGVAPTTAQWSNADSEGGTKESKAEKRGVAAVSSKVEGPNGPSAAKRGAMKADKASEAPGGPNSGSKQPSASAQVVEPGASAKVEASQTAPAATSTIHTHGGPARLPKDGTPSDAPRPPLPSVPLSKDESKQVTSKGVLEPVPSRPPPPRPSGATVTPTAVLANDSGVFPMSNQTSGVPVPKPLQPGGRAENVDSLAYQMQSVNVSQAGWVGGSAASMAPSASGDTVIGKSVLAPKGPLHAPGATVSAPPGHGWANHAPPYPQRTLNAQSSNLGAPAPAPYAGPVPNQLQAHTPDASPQRPAPARYIPAESQGYAPAVQSPPPASYARPYAQPESMGPPQHHGYFAPQPVVHQQSTAARAHPAYPQVSGHHSSPSPAAPVNHASPGATAGAEGNPPPGFNPSTAAGQAGIGASAAGGQGIPYNMSGGSLQVVVENNDQSGLLIRLQPTGNGSGTTGAPSVHPSHHAGWNNTQQSPQPPQPPSFPSYGYMHNGGHQQTGVAAGAAPQYQYGHGPAVAPSWGAGTHGQGQAAPSGLPQPGQGFGAAGYGQQAASPAAPEDDDLDELVAMLG